MVDDDGRTLDHGHPISSLCEPNGSGELIRQNQSSPFAQRKYLSKHYGFYCMTTFIYTIKIGFQCIKDKKGMFLMALLFLDLPAICLSP